jgi:hypothetical protein
MSARTLLVSMYRSTAGALALLTLALASGCTDSDTTPVAPAQATLSLGAGGSNQGFGFNGSASGFPTGAVTLTGGGAFDAATASNTVPSETTVHSAGGFSCTGAVAQGPLSGCAEGEGVRWDTAQLLVSTGFKCTGAAGETNKTATTGPGTVVLHADFYRAGDGIDESFTANMIVSATDLAPDIDGVQNLWVQGVGCGRAVVHFSR